MTPFIAQITMFGGNFAPKGWAFCDGQLLAISSNTALFSLIGITYGGDGQTTFALPDLRGRMPMHPGIGPGLSAKRLGERGGAEETYLNVANMPSHTHSAVVTTDLTLRASDDAGSSDTPAGSVPANTGEDVYGSLSNTPVNMQAGAIGGTVIVQNMNAGGNMPFNNLPPYECVNFIIALVGVFPSRS
ncbi:phage tail protein [Luteolibacter sp. AS25]|uniref:phage tail protein n=1 Tax=Luteolibacter sp. AS25 TaxID=3135776 RepID=UPI00398A591F